MDLGFQIKDNKVLLVTKNGKTKQVPKDCLLEIAQLVLNKISGGRDYLKVTNVQKCLKFIDIEVELADDSDSEDAPPQVQPPQEPLPVPPTQKVPPEVQKIVTKTQPAKVVAPAKKATPQAKKAAPAPKKKEAESEESSSENSSNEE